MAVAVAGCMAGNDKARIAQLPDTNGMNNEILILKSHRFRYDQAVQLTGAKFVEVGLADRTLSEQVIAAITDQTAALLYLAEAESVRGSLPITQIAALLKPAGIPLIVDAAAEMPPFENFTRFLEQGADLVLFSGGKDIRGPQSSGMILGRQDLIADCAMNNYPNHSIGRPMKVDKETIVALVKAIELYCQRDFVAQMASWNVMTKRFVEALASVEGVTAWRGFPTEPGIQPATIPRAYIQLDRGKCGLSIDELSRQLQEGNPGIATGVLGDKLILNPQMLEEDEVDVVIYRLKEILYDGSPL
jgi:L-seryl-tRNA(Ser) seleniumtransferase